MFSREMIATAFTAATVGAVAWFRYMRRPARLYICCQQTPMLNGCLTKFMGMRTLPPGNVKAAMSPFNQRPNQKTLPATIAYNVPVYGPRIQNATIDLFTGPEMAALAYELGVRIPPYELSAFVQKKAV